VGLGTNVLASVHRRLKKNW